ncbi:glycoside hydrolase family 36 protein [Paenibacillus nasutitermitis]|uniref:Alpha-galactosidase n=1 Tax=Paenibacillus nasutitermitis TaxID=1652958 RepID=A0A916Z817_9BACL|nr:glycoside hydrolase family 36 protein [Paenibacillus nasutitermitis]GGD79631.1 alpha-galactosidase [Paenibacillus nasutitermitis]
MENFLTQSDFEIRLSDGNAADGLLNLIRDWQENVCAAKLVSTADEAMSVKEIVLFQGKMPFEPSARIYGEGYNMLSQYGGTVAVPVDIGGYSDRNHYKLPVTDDLFTVYNLALFNAKQGKGLLAFSSCRRFSGEIRFNEHRYEIVLDYENLLVEPGETVELEEFFFQIGEQADDLLRELAAAIERNHPALLVPEVPTGWCSWYCYGAEVTEDDIRRNLAAIKERIPELKYILIDGGYAAYEGDWLEPGKAFPGGIRTLCLTIREMGFEPAMWVGPFLAERVSRVAKEHPEWFKQDENGEPLSSDRDSFGGWYHAPWYMLDGSHPGAQDHLRQLFRTMREEWGVRYFKLDGTMWGALPFGNHHDPKATRVDAFRAGMNAVTQGAGEGSFLLGCNAPMWPSLGTVHGMRTSNDVIRTWGQIRSVAAEILHRNWQHGRLWINDPDVIVTANLAKDQIGPDGVTMQVLSQITADEFRFHATVVYASGGMVFAGDAITDLLPEHLDTIRKLLPPANAAALFEDDSFRIGRIQTSGKLMISLLNWTDDTLDARIALDGRYRIREVWTDQELGQHQEELHVMNLAPHSGQLLECIPISLPPR